MLESSLVVVFFIGLLILCIITRIFTLPLRVLWKCIYNSIIGAIVIYVINFLGIVYIPLNFFTALIAGVLGIPGVIILTIYAML